ncbi:TPA: methyltransferase domain-containing protein [Vibrio cholerae]|nr:methyltransferase domain-containing protein [Vibrio cholerae]HDZ9223356.1 methyltransferase domain-containing protein [Vibrio cholerae]
MHYILNGIKIKSENAAKPETQVSKAVVNYLLDKKGTGRILDFGCGKLRYSETLNKIGTSVTYVDSRVQLTRLQTIKGIKTNVVKYVADNYEGSQVVPFEEIDNHKEKYQLITCTNVISAIPCEKTLNKVLTKINGLLDSDGCVVFVNQHRNSYFKRFLSGQKRLFGHIYKGKRGHSYYGIITPDVMTNLLECNGFKVLKSWTVGESNFVEASRECS